MIEAVWLLLAPLGFWYWIITLVAFGALVGIVEFHDKGGSFATGIIIAYLCGLSFFWEVSVFSWLWNNPFSFIWYAFLYLGIGAAWSTFKWYKFVDQKRDAYEENVDYFMKKHKVTDRDLLKNDPKVKKDWKEFINSHYRYGYVIPTAKENKANIIMWMTYWVFSMFWAITGDLLDWIYSRMYKALSRLADRIVERKFKGVAAEVDFD